VRKTKEILEEVRDRHFFKKYYTAIITNGYKVYISAEIAQLV